jgi:hypothetical protein
MLVTPGISGRQLRLNIAKQYSAHHWKFSKAHSGPRFEYSFQPSVCIRLLRKLCRRQAEVIQNHENEHVRVTDKVKPDIENTRSLNFVVVKLTTVQMAKRPL